MNKMNKKKEKTYIYNGVEYTPRKKSFKPYRSRALVFLNKYNEFEKSYTSTLLGEIQTFLITDKKFAGKIITARNTSNSERISKAVSEALLSSPDYAMKSQELVNKKALAKELFLITDGEGNSSDKNARELCDIMLEDSENINHNPETGDEYSEYMKFIYGLYDDFFEMCQRLTSTVKL